MKVEIKLTTNYYDMRQLCVDNHWYDKGDNDAYSRMIKFAVEHENPTKEDLLVIATDIVTHTDWQHCADTFVAIEHVIWGLLNVAYRFRVDVE